MSFKLIAVTSVAAVVLSAAALTMVSTQAQVLRGGATVTIKCLYHSEAAGGFRSAVAGIETGGRVNRRVSESLAADMSCTAAYNVLADAGFDLVHSTGAPAAGDSDVQAADYVVWRKTSL